MSVRENFYNSTYNKLPQKSKECVDKCVELAAESSQKASDYFQKFATDNCLKKWEVVVLIDIIKTKLFIDGTPLAE